ncbi:hypothetical protein [Roseomonas indoligenes]|uniref:Sel1 repeat family protein n=1 Tax=Roseomonas indoligenes TaxID=2820811 RepID=A0A940MYR2_9PROT|nr:hypothetical protein [Pararoseomonas indoligenes]MBP0493515.1 hypothetical protein [Pararoseomonas indoligenes]
MSSHSLRDEVRPDPLLEAWSSDVLLPACLAGEGGAPSRGLYCALLHRDYGVALLDLASDERPDAAEQFRHLHWSRYPRQPVPPVVYRSLAPMDLWRLTIILDSAFALEPPLAEHGTDWMDRARSILAREPEPELESTPAPVPVGLPSLEACTTDEPSEVEDRGTVAPAAPRRRRSYLLVLPVLAGVAILAMLPWLRSPEPEGVVAVAALGTGQPLPDPMKPLAVEAPPPVRDETRGGEVPREGALPAQAELRLTDDATGEVKGMDAGPEPEVVLPDPPLLAALAVPPPRPLPPLESVAPQPAGPLVERVEPASEVTMVVAPPEVPAPMLPPVPEPPPGLPALASHAEADLPIQATLHLPTVPVLALAPWPEPDRPPAPQGPVLAPSPPQAAGLALPDDIVVPALPPAPAATSRPDETVTAETPGERPIQPVARAEPAPPPGSEPALLQLLLRRGDALLGLGDVSAARLFYERAAAAGSGAAAVAMARTYDPAVLGELGVRGLRPERDTAITWYRRAVALGSADAAGPLERLEMQARAR